MSLRFRLLALVAFVCCAGAWPLAQKPAPAPPKKNPLLKLAEPWPEDDVLLARRTEADSRTLFREAAPLEFTLTSDFSLVNKERSPNNTKRFPAMLSIPAMSKQVAVQIGSRG